MSWSRGISVGLLAFAWASVTGAEKPAFTATVIADGAEVRAGASNSPSMYPTNRLRKGDPVEVVRELGDGWIAVVPPPGSFSWINTKYVRQIVTTQPMWRVEAAPDSRVPLLLGSSLKAEKPTVEGARVSRGMILRAIGPVRRDGDELWLPVVPPPGELRYMRANAVSRSGAAIAATSPGPGAVTPPTTLTGAVPPAGVPSPLKPVSPSPAPPAATGPDALWARAQEAERAMRYEEAIRLYKELGSKVNGTNQALAMQAFTRAQWLSDIIRGRSPNGDTPATSVAKSASRTVVPPAPSTMPAGWVTLGPGYLKRAGKCEGVEAMFLLVDRYDRPISYAIPQRGFQLNDYVNQHVTLIGIRQWRPDMNANLMTVMQVRRP
jgi:hypothetical protein